MDFEESTGDITLEGYLMKWTNACTGWKDRYFILRKNILYYYISKGMRYKGKIHLQVAEIIANEKEVLKFQIDTGIKTIYLWAHSEKDKTSWVDSLTMANRMEQINSKSKQVNNTNSTGLVVKNEDKDKHNLLKKIFNTKVLLDEMKLYNKELQDLDISNINPNKFYDILDKYQVLSYFTFIFYLFIFLTYLLTYFTVLFYLLIL